MKIRKNCPACNSSLFFKHNIEGYYKCKRCGYINAKPDQKIRK